MVILKKSLIPILVLGFFRLNTTSLSRDRTDKYLFVFCFYQFPITLGGEEPTFLPVVSGVCSLTTDRDNSIFPPVLGFL